MDEQDVQFVSLQAWDEKINKDKLHEALKMIKEASQAPLKPSKFVLETKKS